ncbi:MAG: response regulator transcription factor [Deltaproteobacteria bacterium]|nr:response regulator transcription factor [Deltaproteobacteria bacterium]
MAKPILIAEDDTKTANLVAKYLEREGYAVLIVTDGAEALRLADEHELRLVILDLMLPKVDGWEVCRRLRKTSNVPILMLTARGEEIDRVSGLALGADDYVVKPFSPRELVARVQALLRRTEGELRHAPVRLKAGPLVLDQDSYQAWLEDRKLELTLHEFRILAALMEKPGRVLSREQLLSCLYPQGEAVVDRVIDVHIGKLRQKLDTDPARPSHIKTVRGVGYSLLTPEELHEKN